MGGICRALVPTPKQKPYEFSTTFTYVFIGLLPTAPIRHTYGIFPMPT